MSDLQEVDQSQTTFQNEPKSSPPRHSPSPDATEPELRLSRKREREISLEPATPTAANDPDSSIRARKDSSSPLKKNRRHLDSTAEEEDSSGSRSASGSPPTNSVLASPRQEMKRKVRQISRGVEDINWKNRKHSKSSEKSASTDVEPEHEHPLVEQPRPDEDIELNKETLHTVQEGSEADKKAEAKASVELDGQKAAAASNTQPTDDVDVHIPEVQVQGTGDKNAADNPNDGRTSPTTPEESALSQSVPNVRNLDASMLVDPTSPARLRSGSESNDKSLKRKFLERGTSQGPPGQDDKSQKSQEQLKRPRDDNDKDENPREAKRLTPPPSPPRTKPPSPKPVKQSGFLSYASSSPFSGLKGRNVFGSSSKAGSSTASTSTTSVFSTPTTESKSVFGESSSMGTPAPAKKSGFEAFASAASPFATANRGSTPVLGSTSKLGRAQSPQSTSVFSSNPFASYAGTSQGFALPAQKRARAGSPDGSARSSVERAKSTSVFAGSGKGSDSGDEEEKEDDSTSFGEKLRAGRDDDDDWENENKVQLTEQDVLTGEEEEDTVHQVRGKLFSLDGASWKERGTGLLKLNVRASDGMKARLVMRKDAVYTLLLNITLFPGMKCTVAQDPRYVRISAIEAGGVKTYNLRVANSKIATELIEEINAYIPT
ncbi:hypothetical protein D9613_007127 [Agrocybe pediades]|uniref:RanBD1 domain-containing protein n=1 Tax=Agrocybe pediades TaxID=84607 RepID=A0A8H4QGU5_9AGAR|nr:hypothetical protein D9613_007127 [Agrocybe pediades]